MPLKLLPIDFELEIVANQAAPQELQDLGMAYWQISGIDEFTDELVWAHKTTSIEFGPWANTAHHAAAAAVVASTRSYECAECQGVVTLKSRNTLSELRRGKRAKCRECDSTINSRAAQVLGTGKSRYPVPHSSSEAEGDPYESTHTSADKGPTRSVALEAMRRQAIDANYPVDTGDNTQILADASVTARVSALALIHAASKPSGIIFPVKYDDASFAPTAETARKLFLAAFHEGLLIVHPSTPTKGFVWDEASPEVLSDSIYTQFVRFVPPGDGPLDCRLEDFAENLRTSLEIEYMDFDERLELTELLQQLIAGESMRSLSYELGLHGLPSPSDSHLESHRSHALKAAGLFSLGHIYKFAWTAARDASSAYQRIGGMSRANATTHGLNKFATYIQRGIDEPSFLGSPYNERNDLQLSAATDIGFRIVLQANPMTSTPTSLTEDLLISPGSGLPPLCVSTVPDRSAIIEWLRTSDSWTPIDFREALAKLSDETSACLPGCVHERSHVTARFAGELYDRIVSRCGAYDSAIVTAEALRLSNFGADHGLTGDLVLAELAVNLGWEARAVDDLP